MRGWTTLAMGIGLLLAGSVRAADPEPGARFPGAVTLENARVRAVVAPSVGRIVSFVALDGREFLRLRPVDRVEAGAAPRRDDPGPPMPGYRDHGGDKVANARLHDWAYALERKFWPPDETVDGDPWRVTARDATSVTLESGVSRYLGSRMRRTVALAGDGADGLDIDLVLEQVEPAPFFATIWTVTLVPPPERTLLDARWRYPSGRNWLDQRIWTSAEPPAAEIAPRLVRFAPADLSGKPKAGTLGRWLAAVYPDAVFVQVADFDPGGGYGDGASLEVFADPDAHEIETLSPQRHLRPGESLRHRVRWRVFPRPGSDDIELAALIEQRFLP